MDAFMETDDSRLTISDVVERQNEIPSQYRGNIYAYLMFGMEG